MASKQTDDLQQIQDQQISPQAQAEQTVARRLKQFALKLTTDCNSLSKACNLVVETILPRMELQEKDPELVQTLENDAVTMNKLLGMLKLTCQIASKVVSEPAECYEVLNQSAQTVQKELTSYYKKVLGCEEVIAEIRKEMEDEDGFYFYNTVILEYTSESFEEEESGVMNDDDILINTYMSDQTDMSLSTTTDSQVGPTMDHDASWKNVFKKGLSMLKTLGKIIGRALAGGVAGAIIGALIGGGVGGAVGAVVGGAVGTGIAIGGTVGYIAGNAKKE